MIPAMTEPTRRSTTVPVNGRDVTVFELTDAQMMLLTRHGKILDSTSVSKAQKEDSAMRTMTILDSIILDEDKEYVTNQQEIGKLTLMQMVEFVKAFAPQKTATKVTRGRAKRVA